MIYILTGAIRTGKTSALLNWANSRNDVGGLLCPDDENGKRYFLNIKSNETFELEVETESESEDIIKIGNFKFLESAFDKAHDILVSMTSEAKNTYLIIDELGKLELKNKGLHRSAETLIPNYINNQRQHLILVVRDYLFEDVLNHYSISEYLVLKKQDLEVLE